MKKPKEVWIRHGLKPVDDPRAYGLKRREFKIRGRMYYEISWYAPQYTKGFLNKSIAATTVEEVTLSKVPIPARILRRKIFGVWNWRG